MTQEDINNLHKLQIKVKSGNLPVCGICGEKFLGYTGDKVCLECRMEICNEKSQQ